MCECSDLRNDGVETTLEVTKEKTIEEVAKDDAKYYLIWTSEVARELDFDNEKTYNLLIEKMRLDLDLQKYNMLLDVSIEKAIDEITKSL